MPNKATTSALVRIQSYVTNAAYTLFVDYSPSRVTLNFKRSHLDASRTDFIFKCTRVIIDPSVSPPHFLIKPALHHSGEGESITAGGETPKTLAGSGASLIQKGCHLLSGIRPLLMAQVSAACHLFLGWFYRSPPPPPSLFNSHLILPLFHPLHRPPSPSSLPFLPLQLNRCPPVRAVRGCSSRVGNGSVRSCHRAPVKYAWGELCAWVGSSTTEG